MDNNNFVFKGFPGMDDEFEIEQIAPSKKKPIQQFPDLSQLGSQLGGFSMKFITPEDLSKIMGMSPELEEDFNEGLEALSKMDSSELASMIEQTINIMLGKGTPNKEEESEGDELEELLGSIPSQIAQKAGKPQKKEVFINSTNSFLSLKNNPRILYPKICKGNIISNFFQEYGELESYPVEIFADSELKVIATDYSNEEDILDKVGKLSLVEATENYILFRAIPEDADLESFMIALGEGKDGIFTLYIPIYGNTIIEENGELSLFSKTTNMDLYDELGNFTQTVDINKVKAECNLIFYKDTNPITSVKDFGKILHVQKYHTNSLNAVWVGTIHSNDSYKAKQFIKDYSFPEEEKKFNFYIKLEELRDKFILDRIAEFLTVLDFNNNPMIQDAELFPCLDGIGIKLNLKELEENIGRWLSE